MINDESIRVILRDMENIFVVIDNGSESCKAGFAGEESPRVVLPSVVGTPRTPDVSLLKHLLDGKEFVVGQTALDKRGILRLRCPIDGGVMSNFDDLEKIWSHLIYEKLGVNENGAFDIVLTESALNSAANRNKMAEIMFEKFNANSVSIFTHAELILLANDCQTGLIVDSGHGHTHISAFYNGKLITESLKNFMVTGRDLMEYFSWRVRQRPGEVAIKYRAEMKDAQHTVCYVAQDINKESESYPDEDGLVTKFTIKDNTEVVIGNECFLCPEILFSPKQGFITGTGIQHYIHDSIISCPEEIRETLYKNIYLSGGNTLFSGLEERLKKEVANVAGNGIDVNVIAPSNRMNSVWCGGSKAPFNDTFKGKTITKENYKNVS